MKSVAIMEGKITPKEEMLSVKGTLSGFKYFHSVGGKTSRTENRYTIYFEDGREYNIYESGIYVFDRENLNSCRWEVK